MYVLLCIKSFKLEDTGHFWTEGETYTLERNDLLTYQKIIDFLNHFEPKNPAAATLYEDK